MTNCRGRSETSPPNPLSIDGEGEKEEARGAGFLFGALRGRARGKVSGEKVNYRNLVPTPGPSPLHREGRKTGIGRS